MAPDAPDDGLRSAIREALAAAPGMASEPEGRADQLAEEFMPFAQSVARTGGSEAHAEARSLAWLFAHRLGDQGVTALATTAALVAWRDVVGTDGARKVADAVLPLLLDGYARAREERCRRDLQGALGESLPVAEAAPGVVLAVAAGPMDADAARALADRTGRLMLHREGRAVLLDLSGLQDPDAACLSELWGVVASARMLGAHCVVVGESPALTLAIEGASLGTDGVRRAPTLAAGIEALGRDHGVTLNSGRHWLSWVFGVIRSATRREPAR